MLNDIPLELRLLPQWVVSGVDKVPLHPVTKKSADVTKPETWGTYEQAIASGMPHVGFVLTSSDPYTIIDLDAPQTVEQTERHRKVFDALDSYAEVSQSGQGVHIICRGRVPRGVRRDRIEVYSEARYMICTGRVIRNVEIAGCQDILDIMYREMNGNGNGSTVELAEYEPLMSDRDLVEMASNAVNGEKFDKLCNGDWENDYPSQSEADFALLSIFAFYTRSNEQVMRLFRMSALGKRDKAMRDSYLKTCLTKIRANDPDPVDFTRFEVPTPLPTPTPKNQNGDADAGNRGDDWQGSAAVQPVPSAGGAHLPPALGARGNVADFPPGLVGEVANYIYTTSSRPVVEVATASAIALCAGIVGRQFNISGTGLNQYLILLAKTGVGKEEGIKGIDRLISPLRQTIPMVDQFLGPGTFASGQAIIRTLDEKPCFVSTVGEFGLMLHTLSDQNAHERALVMRRILLDVYGKSGRGSLLRSSAYADREKNTKIVASPAMTLFGESTPETFYEGLNLSQIADGLVPRFLIMEYGGDRPRRNRTPYGPPNDALLARLAELLTVSLQMQGNNAWCDVQLDSDAQALMDAFDRHCDDNIVGAGAIEGIRQLWNRAHLKALKLAGLLAAADRPHDPVVNHWDAEWAIALVRRDAERIVERFATGDVGEGESKQRADIIRVLSDYFSRPASELKRVYEVPEEMHAARIVPLVYLMRRTAGLSAFRKHKLGARNALAATVKDLLDTEILVEVPKKTMVTKFNTGQKSYFVNLQRIS